MKRLIKIPDTRKYIDRKTGKIYMYKLDYLLTPRCRNLVEEVYDGKYIFIGSHTMKEFDEILSMDDEISQLCSLLNELLTHIKYAPPAPGGSGYHAALEDFDSYKKKIDTTNIDK